jgi:hypothetical protein
MPTQAAASSQQAALAAAQARAGSNAGSVNPVAGYAMFCQNSLSLCAPAAPTPPDPGYVQFYWNSPTLGTVLKPN